MKFNYIEVFNLFGIKNVDIVFIMLVMLIVGCNGNGKILLVELVCMVLIGVLQVCEVMLKKELQVLVNEQVCEGYVEVQIEGCELVYVMLFSGKMLDVVDYMLYCVLFYVFLFECFGVFVDNDCCVFLFGLMGLSMKVENIIECFVKCGVDKVKVECVGLLLKVGFDVVCKEVKGKVIEVKGFWCVVIGEIYGVVKVVGWIVLVLVFD